ncbi:hypothetical protein ACN38_g4503 [Penicillium nordicum]|uniref:Major facilitator superfamily (MFS) profile domain-containing protein n=1 Tax=Penicillium nordicum TaxID=229535 RepID=A0A0M9WH20_9EURO|nr:hypothetical protein ACN38_g4503 [Penicillium nordicum]
MACIVLGGLAGAPLGAFLTSVLGWRISFFLHIPLVFICAIITTFKLFAGSKASSKETGLRNEENCPKKPATDRPSLDMGGIITLTCTIVAFVLLIQLSTEYDLSGSHIGIPIGLGVALLVCATLFGIVEVKWASNPVIPFQLVKTTQVGQIWGATFFSSMANFVLASTISPYFVQTHELTTAQSGLSLIPQSVGATIGAILTGIIVKRTGRYKACAIIGLCVAIVSHVIIIVRWSVFEPFMWELIYTATAGFGATMSCSAQFVALSSAVSEKQITVAITSYYLFQQIGNMIGIALTQPLQRLLFEKLLGKKIGTDLEAAKTIKHILDNAQFSWSLPSTLHGVVNFCFRQSYLISPVLSIVALSSALLLLIKLKDTTV